MPSETATAIAYVGAFVGLLGGGVALYNAWKAVRWKRAELANAYLKDLVSNQKLVFACRALDWNGGRLVAPENLRPFLPKNESSILHDPGVLTQAMRRDLRLSDLEADPRIQLYRTTMDTFLSWLSLVSSALDRNLFITDDVADVGYWIARIDNAVILNDFIHEFGYSEHIQTLRKAFSKNKLPFTTTSEPA